MALGRRTARQEELFIPTAELARGSGHPYHTKLNAVLTETQFDPFVEDRCAPYYKAGGRIGIAPGVYFRRLFSGYFEGWTASAALPGAALTAWPCGPFWASPSPSARRGMPR